MTPTPPPPGGASPMPPAPPEPPRRPWWLARRVLLAGLGVVLLSGAATAVLALNELDKVVEALGQNKAVKLSARLLAPTSRGGPETLLHGDLWTSNLFVTRSADGPHARLTDWDRAGVGPMSYDLSTFLLRFPAAQRAWILDVYTRSLENHAWRPPAPSRLNLLFETAELSRYANRVIWPAQAIARDGAPWGFEELAEVERWFGALDPVLAGERPAPEALPHRAAGDRSWSDA